MARRPRLPGWATGRRARGLGAAVAVVVTTALLVVVATNVVVVRSEDGAEFDDPEAVPPRDIRGRALGRLIQPGGHVAPG